MTRAVRQAGLFPRPYSRSYEISLSPPDAAAFSTLLRRTFPQLLILPKNYHLKPDPGQETGPGWTRRKFIPAGKTLRKYDSLADPDAPPDLIVALPQAGWQPEWQSYADHLEFETVWLGGLAWDEARYRDAAGRWQGCFAVANLPVERFEIQRTDLPPPPHWQRNVIPPARMWCWYRPEALEPRRFIDRAARLLKRLSNPFVIASPGRAPWNCHVHIGLHMRRWLRANDWRLDAGAVSDDDTPWSELEQRLRRERRASKAR